MTFESFQQKLCSNITKYQTLWYNFMMAQKIQIQNTKYKIQICASLNRSACTTFRASPSIPHPILF